MDDKTANELDRLLAGGGMSGAEADAIFDRVIASVESADRRRHVGPRVLWSTGILAAAAVALIAFSAHPARPPAFTARGASVAVPRLELICSGGTLEACPLSSKLIFAVAGDATTGFLSAYAEPLEPGTERVWYFSKSNQSPELPRIGEGTRVFERAVQIAGTHRPGRYRVHLFLSDVPLGQEQMLANTDGLATARSEVELRVSGE
jgi:hypothetical protein